VPPDPAACTCAVGFDVAVAVPSVLRAVICTRRRLPRSAAVATYCVLVAPEIGVQLAPAASQPCHAYE
jgi:hypothetical protein